MVQKKEALGQNVVDKLQQHFGSTVKGNITTQDQKTLWHMRGFIFNVDSTFYSISSYCFSDYILRHF